MIPDSVFHAEHEKNIKSCKKLFLSHLFARNDSIMDYVTAHIETHRIADWYKMVLFVAIHG